MNLADQAARDAITKLLDKTMMVEAGAGSGKTTALVKRMAALIAEGKAEIRSIAAVTFTRKAAAELKQKFQLALEQGFKDSEGDRKELIGRALQDLEQGFVGTIHSFCAQLLRERPVEAGIDPAFIEMDEMEDGLSRNETWETYLSKLLVEDEKVFTGLYEMDVTLDELKEAYHMLVLYPEVRVETEDCPPPDTKMAKAEVSTFLAYAEKKLPDSVPDNGLDGVQEQVTNLCRMMRALDPDEARDFFRIITPLESEKGVTQNRWPSKDDAKNVEMKLSDLRARIVLPMLTAWRRYRHSHLMNIIRPAADLCKQRRAEASTLNFQDLLQLASSLLRDNPEVRKYFRKRFTHLLVDEFQDTDPIQAEVMFYLTGSDMNEKNWKKLKPEEGSLFVVGDPKQSIYRFRRADIDTYNLVKTLIQKAGGDLVELKSNFRSVTSIGEWLNPVFETRFPKEGTKYQAAFIRLETVRGDGASCMSGPRKITTQKVYRNKAEAIVENDSLKIASWIKHALEGGIKIERTEDEKALGLDERPVPSDFLILLRNKKRIPEYAMRLEEFGIPFEVAGGNAFSSTYALGEILKILKAVADPDSAVDLVAALRGLFFGISDDVLYQFRKAGGRFSFYSDVPDGAPKAVVSVMKRSFERLKLYRGWSRTLPPSVAIEKIIEDVGMMPYLMNQDMAGSRTGNIMKVLEYLHRAELAGTMEFLSVVEDLEEVTADGEMDEIDISHGSRKAVRIMNLHKAKGLESPVVFLANPTGKSDHPPKLHIRREADQAVGHFVISFKSNYHDKTIAIPPDWDKYAADEYGYVSAEEDRLLYVAGTRAKNVLVISSYPAKGDINYWSLFDHYLGAVKELESPQVKTRELKTFFLKKKVFDQAQELLMRNLESFGSQTHSVVSVTSLPKEGIAMPSWRRTGRGMSWGNVIHHSLEAVNKGISGKELDVLVTNILTEEGRPLEDKATVLSVIEEIRKSKFWKEVEKAEKKLTEVPFSLRLKPSELGFTSPMEEYVILSGVIDLVYKDQNGWTIVDYKTDDVGNNIQDFVRYYSPQVKAYSRYWEEVSGEKVSRTGLFFVQRRKFIEV